MQKVTFAITKLYIIILGITLGAVLYAGIVVAPVTFGSEAFLGKVLLSRYEEGRIMSENFRRLSYLTDMTALWIVVMTWIRFKMFLLKKIEFIAAFIAFSCALLFGHYYLPDILALQEAGEAMTQTEAFDMLHKGSEINMKLFAVALAILLWQLIPSQQKQT